MTENRFRTVALVLRPYVGGTYDLLEAADAVVALDPPAVAASAVLPIPHALLVMAALGSEAVMTEVRAGKRINAIKALRMLSKNSDDQITVGLKAAKEAIEDVKVEAFFNVDNLVPQGDPWGMDFHRDEPPF